MLSQYQPNARYSPSSHTAAAAARPMAGTPSQLPHGANTSLPDHHDPSLQHTSNHHHQGGVGMPALEGVLFEHEVMVLTKQLDREEVTQPLLLTVSTGKGGPQGISRCVTVRITDPANAFFLYVMELLEDEYGRFKDTHELHVDFAGFSRDLVNMLATAIETGSYVVSLSVEHAGKGQLRILEKTGFRSVEHLKLDFLRQGDENQKKYLAERFNFFQNAFLECDEAKRQNEESSAQLTDALRRDIEILTGERDKARQQLQLESSQSQSDKLGELAKLREESRTTSEAQRQHQELEMQQLRASTESQLSESKAKLQSKEDECRQTLARLNGLEHDFSTMQERLTRTTDAEARKGKEIAQSNKQIEELLEFQRTATQRMTEYQLDAVATKERVKHLTESNQSKEGELKMLRDQVVQKDSYVRMLQDQTEVAQAKSKSLEGNLAKSHHIIKTMMSHQEMAKEKLSALTTQLEAKQEAMGERGNTIDRLKAELNATLDKVNMLQGYTSQAKEQLAKVEDEKQSLQASLRQSEEAIIHIQRQSSGLGHRSYPTTSAGGGATFHATSGMTAPRGLHQEFARGMQSSGMDLPGGAMPSSTRLRQPDFLNALSTSGVAGTATTPTPSVEVSTPGTVGRQAVPTSAGSSYMMGPTTSSVGKPIGGGMTDRHAAAAAESAYFPSS